MIDLSSFGVVRVRFPEARYDLRLVVVGLDITEYYPFFLGLAYPVIRGSRVYPLPRLRGFGPLDRRRSPLESSRSYRIKEPRGFLLPLGLEFPILAREVVIDVPLYAGVITTLAYRYGFDGIYPAEDIIPRCPGLASFDLYTYQFRRVRSGCS